MFLQDNSNYECDSIKRVIAGIQRGRSSEGDDAREPGASRFRIEAEPLWEEDGGSFHDPATHQHSWSVEQQLLTIDTKGVQIKNIEGVNKDKVIPWMTLASCGRWLLSSSYYCYEINVNKVN